MPPHISGSVASRDTRDRGLRYWLIACSLVLAIISILISIRASAGTIWVAAAPASEAMEGNVPRISVDLPDGCEALASPLARCAVADIAGRCVS
jgi:hypothetical protein